MSDNSQKITWPGWETVQLIGQGSFGAVYEIQRDMFGDIEKAALKVITIPQNRSDIDELYSDGYDEESITNTFHNHLQSIVAEYSLMRKMNGNSNIVNCDDVRYVQHEDGIGWDIFIKMELLTPLAKALPAEITEELVIKIAKDMCGALELCKKYDIVHRDIKPQNIFVSPNGDFKLGDFGIAKTVEKTMGGTKIGTYKYMAPEVYNNQPYGSAADIYSLGLVLYWLLNERRMPFLPLPPEKLKPGMDEQARNRRLSGEPIPAPAHGSEGLKNIVLKACAYDVKDRYTSAAEMLADLNELGGVVVAPDGEAEVSRVAVENIEQHKETSVEMSENDKVFMLTKAKTVENNELVEKVQKTVGAELETDTVEASFFEAEELPKKKTKKRLGGLGCLACVFLVLGIISLVYVNSRKAAPIVGNNKSAPIVEIDAYHPHVVALRSDGTVSVLVDEKWDKGQGNTESWRDIVAVSAGLSHTVGLKGDGTVVAVGNNENGQCEVSEWTDIIAICAGVDSTYGLKRNGTVVVAANYEGFEAYSDSFAELTNVKCIEVLANQFMWLDTKGNVSIRYNNFVGEDGNGVISMVLNNTDCESFCGVGFNYAIGLNENGIATIVNPDEYMELDCGNLQDVEGGDWCDLQQIDNGYYHVMGLRSDGTVVSCGDNTGGQCNVSAWTDIIDVAAGANYSLGLKSDGTIVAAGNVPFDVTKLYTK